MTKAAKPAWKDCEICRDLPDGDWYDAFSSGGFKEGFSRLERRASSEFSMFGLRRCPLCHTFYLETGENCQDHYASYLMSIDRVNDEEVLQELSSEKSKKAKEWLVDIHEKWLDDLHAEMGKS